MINPGLMSSKTDEWATPQKLFDSLNKEFNFKVDVCASAQNHKCPLYFDREKNGLKEDWSKYGVAFLNPPYGRTIKEWTHKAVEEAAKGCIVVGLIPNRSDTNWYENVMKAAEIRIIKGRLHFNDGPNPAPFPSIIVVWTGEIKRAPDYKYYKVSE